MKNFPHYNDFDLEGFEKICLFKDLKEFIGKRFLIDDVEIAVFKINGEIFALSNICPHQHTPLIYDGFIEEAYVVCPAHGWMFNLKTGRTPAGRKGLDSYEVKIYEDDVYVKVIKRELKW